MGINIASARLWDGPHGDELLEVRAVQVHIMLKLTRIRVSAKTPYWLDRSSCMVHESQDAIRSVVARWGIVTQYVRFLSSHVFPRLTFLDTLSSTTVLLRHVRPLPQRDRHVGESATLAGDIASLGKIWATCMNNHCFRSRVASFGHHHRELAWSMAVAGVEQTGMPGMDPSSGLPQRMASWIT